jgi:hypothetical protein
MNRTAILWGVTAVWLCTAGSFLRLDGSRVSYPAHGERVFPYFTRLHGVTAQNITFFTHVRFEVFMAVTMKKVVFWDIKPSSYFTGDTLRLRYRVQLVNAM